MIACYIAKPIKREDKRTMKSIFVRFRAALKCAVERIRKHYAEADEREALQLAEYACYLNNWREG